MFLLSDLILQTTVNRQSIRDIKPPFDVPPNYMMYIILGIVIVVGLSLGVFYLRKHRLNKTITPIVEVESRPAHEIALEQLNALEKDTKDMETFHTQISYVIREYITARFHIPALELTTSSLLREMISNQVDKSCIDRLQDFLTNCDRVKFASYLPNTSEADKRMIDARWIIDTTIS
ncbi:hypothetical protein C6497_04020 [Candidatus Poribacteria bacterium]|nr:MAG: hypothetical protein C6497_04020 [Candidatus Poribacteria bacterium]